MNESSISHPLFQSLQFIHWHLGQFMEYLSWQVGPDRVRQPFARETKPNFVPIAITVPIPIPIPIPLFLEFAHSIVPLLGWSLQSANMTMFQLVSAVLSLKKTWDCQWQLLCWLWTRERCGGEWSLKEWSSNPFELATMFVFPRRYLAHTHTHTQMCVLSLKAWLSVCTSPASQV